MTLNHNCECSNGAVTGIAGNSPLPNMKQQTAVEWLWNLSQTKELQASDFEQALAMERDQHGQTWDAAIHAHDARGHVYARSMCDFDDYWRDR